MSPLPSAPSRTRAVDARLRTTYLSEVLATLYPAGRGGTCYLPLPHPHRPRLLVPAGTPRAAAAAVRHYSEPPSWRARLVRRAAADALRCGAARIMAGNRIGVDPAGSVQQHLQQLVGEPIALAVHIGPSRANRKPVLPMFAAGGRLLGFAKLGTGPLTRGLVRGEAGALAMLARLPLREVQAPRADHAGRWGDHELLVQSPLPVWRRRVPVHPERLVSAMREVATCCGTLISPLGGSSYWRRLRRRLGLVLDQPEGVALARAAAALGRHAEDVEFRYGAWHGDWSPWNMAALEDAVLLWDWERFSPGVPLGFDALHYHLQLQLRTTPDAGRAVTAMLARTDALLAPFDVPPPARQVTALLYCADLAARYLADRQAEAGARLGVLGTWLLPALLSQIEELT